MKSFIVEISCPCDAFQNTCYNTKFSYYQPLDKHINDTTLYSCKKIVLIVGGLGTTNRRHVWFKNAEFTNQALQGNSQIHWCLYCNVSFLIGQTRSFCLSLFLFFGFVFLTNGMFNLTVGLDIALWLSLSLFSVSLFIYFLLRIACYYNSTVVLLWIDK